MANIIRIKRRLASSPLGTTPPTGLKNAELAFNEVDNTLYYGKGDNGNGSATETIKIAGAGYVETLVSNVSGTLNDSITALRSEVQTVSSELLSTVEANLNTVLGTDLSALQVNLNSISELASSLSGDAEFAVNVNNRLNAISDALSGSGGTDSRLDVLETGFNTLTSESGVSKLGTIASQNSDAVNITGGTISVSALTVTESASLKDVTATGTLNVSGAVTLGSSLAVDGQADVTGALNVDGAVDMDSTLDVQGAATFQSSLSVAGQADIVGALNVDGAVDMDSTLDVQGAATFQSSLSVAGQADIVGALNVDGAVDIDSTLDVQGAATLQSSLSVAGTANFDSNVTVAGNFEVGTGTSTLFVGSSAVGVNTETPSEAFEVVGNGKFSGTVEVATPTLSGHAATKDYVDNALIDGGTF